MTLLANQDGSLAYDPATGQLVIAPSQEDFEDCCCGTTVYPLTPCPPDGCSACEPDDTPSAWSLTLSGFDAGACEGCAPMSEGGPFHLNDISLGLDGVYLLEQTSACTWQTEGGSVSAEVWYTMTTWVDYFENHCFTPPNYNCGTSSGTFRLELHRAGSNLDLTITAELENATCAIEVPVWAAMGVPSGGGGCADTHSWSVSNDCGPTNVNDWFDPWYITSGGSASATPDVAQSNPCPGGAVIYTDTDLSAYVGQVVKINGICFSVGSPMQGESDGAVSVQSSHADCEACCG